MPRFRKQQVMPYVLYIQIISFVSVPLKDHTYTPQFSALISNSDASLQQ